MFQKLTPRQFVFAVNDIFKQNEINSPKHHDSPMDRHISKPFYSPRSVVNQMKNYLDDQSFLHKSALGRINTILETIHEEEEDEDDIYLDDNYDTLYDFIDALTSQTISDFTDEDYVVTTNMSANLRRLFGENIIESHVEIDWKPPTTYGLGNSERIIPFNNSNRK